MTMPRPMSFPMPTPKVHDDYIKHLTKPDVFCALKELLGLMDGRMEADDIDHLGNRRLRSVGELLQNQFRIGLSRMERVVRERMTIQDAESIAPQLLINIRPVVAALKEFFRLQPDHTIYGPDKPAGGIDP